MNELERLGIEATVLALSKKVKSQKTGIKSLSLRLKYLEPIVRELKEDTSLMEIMDGLFLKLDELDTKVKLLEECQRSSRQARSNSSFISWILRPCKWLKNQYRRMRGRN